VATFSPDRFACASLEWIVYKYGHDPAKASLSEKRVADESPTGRNQRTVGLRLLPSPTTTLIQASVPDRPIALPPEETERPMPITPFLDGLQFDPETRRLIGVAFEMARVALEQQWVDHADTILAGRIIALAQAGERNPDALCEQALYGLRSQRNAARAERPPGWRAHRKGRESTGNGGPGNRPSE
jgi:hypothetical protein